MYYGLGLEANEGIKGVMVISPWALTLKTK